MDFAWLILSGLLFAAALIIVGKVIVREYFREKRRNLHHLLDVSDVDSAADDPEADLKIRKES